MRKNLEQYMKEAIALSKKGYGFVSPNPIVGAVIVKEGKIIASGYHEKYGELHAERNALKNWNSDITDATMFVTLEPCCHYGKTPPCTKAIIESGIKEVYVASLDPNPLMAGKGIEELRKHGITVHIGMLKEEYKRANEVFFHYMTTKTPYVVVKYAMTLDGRINSSFTKQITGKESIERVHHDRHKYSSIMVGVGTLLADDPMLNCRIEGLTSPVRLIMDSNLRTPLSSKIVMSAKDIRTIIFTLADEEKHSPYTKHGCEVVKIDSLNSKVDLLKTLEYIGKIGIDSVYIEGGSRLICSALKAKSVQKVHSYIAPKFFSGEDNLSPTFGEELQNIKSKIINCEKLGDDIFIESEMIYPCSPE